MKIGIDARLMTYRRGMGHFVYSLVHALARQPDRHEYVLYTSDERAVAAAPRDSRFTVRRVGPTLDPVWEQWSLPRAARADGVDLLHCPANTGPLSLDRGIGLVVTIHDVMFLLPKSLVPDSPSLYQRLGRRYRSWNVRRIARRAERITTVSEFSRQDILRQLGVAADKVQVVSEAPNPIFQRIDREAAREQVVRRFGLAGRWIVAPGSLDPRKNSLRLIAAFASGAARADQQLQLVIVGLKPFEQAKLAAQAEACGVAAQVSLLGFVEEHDLVALYNSADVVAYPSLYEGFGLPVLEAMSCGAAVLSSNVTSIPEIAGDAALLVDPHDSEVLSDGLARLACDEPLRQRYIAAGFARARHFSWDAVACNVLASYAAAMCQPASHVTRRAA